MSVERVAEGIVNVVRGEMEETGESAAREVDTVARDVVVEIGIANVSTVGEKEERVDRKVASRGRGVASTR